MKKYVKPIVRDLRTLQPVSGSCRSGTPEYSVTEVCRSGGTAFPPCDVGTIVLVDQFCNVGNLADLSCWVGHQAA